MTSTAHPAVGSDWREFTDRDAREDQIGTDLAIDLAALDTGPGF